MRFLTFDAIILKIISTYNIFKAIVAHGYYGMIKVMANKLKYG